VVRAVWERLGSIPVAVASPEPQGLAGAFSGLAGAPYRPAAVRLPVSGLPRQPLPYTTRGASMMFIGAPPAVRAIPAR
jgi:hypothetical protein